MTNQEKIAITIVSTLMRWGSKYLEHPRIQEIRKIIVEIEDKDEALLKLLTEISREFSAMTVFFAIVWYASENGEELVGEIMKHWKEEIRDIVNGVIKGTIKNES